MQQSSNGCRYSNSKTTLAFNDFTHGRKTWQTIVKNIRVAVSKAEISLRTLATVRSKLVEAYRELLHVTA